MTLKSIFLAFVATLALVQNAGAATYGRCVSENGEAANLQKVVLDEKSATFSVDMKYTKHFTHRHELVTLTAQRKAGNMYYAKVSAANSRFALWNVQVDQEFRKHGRFEAASLEQIQPWFDASLYFLEISPTQMRFQWDADVMGHIDSTNPSNTLISGNNYELAITCTLQD